MNFQKKTLVICGVILVITLLVYAFISHNQLKNALWPPVVGNCPDYWEYDNNGKCKNTKKLASYNNTTDANCINPDFSKYQGNTGSCFKKKWADNCGYEWEGITDNKNICN